MINEHTPSLEGDLQQEDAHPKKGGYYNFSWIFRPSTNKGEYVMVIGWVIQICQSFHYTKI